MLVLMKIGATVKLFTAASIAVKVESFAQVGSSVGLHLVMLMLIAEKEDDDIFPFKLRI